MDRRRGKSFRVAAEQLQLHGHPGRGQPTSGEFGCVPQDGTSRRHGLRHPQKLGDRVGEPAPFAGQRAERSIGDALHRSEDKRRSGRIEHRGIVAAKNFPNLLANQFTPVYTHAVEPPQPRATQTTTPHSRISSQFSATSPSAHRLRTVLSLEVMEQRNAPGDLRAAFDPLMAFADTTPLAPPVSLPVPETTPQAPTAEGVRLDLDPQLNWDFDAIGVSPFAPILVAAQSPGSAIDLESAFTNPAFQPWSAAPQTSANRHVGIRAAAGCAYAG